VVDARQQPLMIPAYASSSGRPACLFSCHTGFTRRTPPVTGSTALPRLGDGLDSEALARQLVAESGVLP